MGQTLEALKFPQLTLRMCIYGPSVKLHSGQLVLENSMWSLKIGCSFFLYEPCINNHVVIHNIYPLSFRGLSHRKTGNKNVQKCFATLLQNRQLKSYQIMNINYENHIQELGVKKRLINLRSLQFQTHLLGSLKKCKLLRDSNLLPL